jgi:hypothetical protein
MAANHKVFQEAFCRIAVKQLEPVAKRRFCNFNGVDRLRLNGAGRDTGADGAEGAGQKRSFAIAS